MAGKSSPKSEKKKRPVQKTSGAAREGAKRKKAILEGLPHFAGSIKAALGSVGIPQATYYKWVKQYKAKGLDGLNTGAPVSDKAWNRFVDMQKKPQKVIKLVAGKIPKAKAKGKKAKAKAENLLFRHFDEGMSRPPQQKVVPKKKKQAKAAKKTAAQKTGQAAGRKDKIGKLLFKRFDVAPSQPPEKKAASKKQPTPEPVRAEVQAKPAARPSHTPPSQEPTDNTLKYAIAALAFLVAIFLMTSASNSNKMYFKQDAEKVELWEGKFAPMGETLVATFSDSMVLEGIKKKDSYTKQEAYGALADYFAKKAGRTTNR